MGCNGSAYGAQDESINNRIYGKGNTNPLSAQSFLFRILDGSKSYITSGNNANIYNSNNQSHMQYNLYGMENRLYEKMDSFYKQVDLLKHDLSENMEDLKLSNKLLQERISSVEKLLEQLLDQGQKAYPSERKDIYPILAGKKLAGYVEYDLAA